MRRPILLLLLLGLLAAPLATQEDGDEILRLRDGRLLVARILRHDLDGLEVEEARRGSRLTLAWGDLFPGEEERLKTAFGYRMEAGEPQVAASRLLLRNGQQLTGRILRRDEEHLQIRIRDSVITLPLARLAAPPEEVTVPATQVLTPEQYYAEQVLEVDPEDALAQYEFARDLQAVGAYEQALEHLDRARELAEAAGDQALLRRVQGSLEAVARALAHQEEAGFLQEIRQLMYRERFAQAEALLGTYEERFPDGGLRADYLDLVDGFAARRRQAMERRLTRRWFDAVVGLVKRKALDRESSVDAIMEWATETLPQEVRKRLLPDLQEMQADLQASDLDALWAERVEHGARRHQAAYGTGTWILGEDKARAGLKEPDAAEEDTRSAQQRELEERMKRYLENVERARRAAAGGSEEDSPEAWWRRASPTSRFQWLLAYYAEFSGDYQVTSVRFDNCPTCGGTGVVYVTEMGSAGSKMKKVKCPTCHGVAIQRALTFR